MLIYRTVHEALILLAATMISYFSYFSLNSESNRTGSTYSRLQR
jgi:hypothetical protein